MEGSAAVAPRPCGRPAHVALAPPLCPAQAAAPSLARRACSVLVLVLVSRKKRRTDGRVPAGLRCWCAKGEASWGPQSVPRWRQQAGVACKPVRGPAQGRKPHHHGSSSRSKGAQLREGRTDGRTTPKAGLPPPWRNWPHLHGPRFLPHAPPVQPSALLNKKDPASISSEGRPPPAINAMSFNSAAFLIVLFRTLFSNAALQSPECRRHRHHQRGGGAWKPLVCNCFQTDPTQRTRGWGWGVNTPLAVYGAVQTSSL